MPFVTAWTNRLGNRDDNQDRSLVLQRPQGVLLAVADGMGGHARGDLAAETAVDSLRRSFLSYRDPVSEPQSFLEQALNHAHLSVVDTGQAHQPPLTPRTTCVVCLVQGNRAWWAHLGDSRLYLIRDGRVAERTRDHTPVEELVRQGMLSEQEIRNHPARNSVSRCVGGTPALPEPAFGEAELEDGDTLLLCSDGLWSALEEQRLCDLPEDAGTLEQRINQLADEADVATYPHSDNISLVAMRWLTGQAETTPAPEQADNTGDAPCEPGDPLEQAIADIHRAMLEYAGEMKK